MYQKVDLEKLLKEKKISQRTFDKVTIAKQIIERKYNLQGSKYTEWNNIIEKINSLDISEEQKDKIKQEIYNQEVTKYRKAREKQSIRDYESLSIIGRGAFGEVHVCREKKTGQIVAVKKIRKDILILKNQVIHVRNEQLFMSRVKSPWIVELKASFQEDDYLYLVMEYLPGGDFMNLLIKKDILSEDEARFYTAELILAIESIHKLDCIHRDIKPDNVLIDKTGHIKLSDFGLAKVSDKIFEKKEKIEDFEPNSHQKNYSCVGTAYYVAPEVLKKKGYGPEVDWWSVGVIFFEMLVGYAPFCSKETSEVCYKVLNWKKYLKIPSKVKISEEAEDLICKLINNSNERLGLNGAEEIKIHPFFKGIDWENIRNTKSPFIPELKNDYDTSYFEKYETKEPFYPPVKRRLKRKDIEYMGYTYKDDSFNDITLLNEYENSMKAINFIKKEKDNNELIHNSTMENGGGNNKNSLNNTNNDFNGLNKKINNLSINLEDDNKTNNNINTKLLISKKINTKINANKNIIIDKNNIINKINTANTISYNNTTSNGNNNKFNKKIKIYYNNNYNKNKNICYTDRNNNKIVKTEPNYQQNEKLNYNYKNDNSNEKDNSINLNNKLNIIQLPSKKIKDKINKKIIFPENGAVSTGTGSGKYIIKKSFIKSSSNKNKNIPHKFSPQPKDIILKKFALSKSKLKKKNEINNGITTSKSSEKNVFKKYPFKSSISQNPIKKKYIGINSAKSIFINKKIATNNLINNNSNNNGYNEIYNNICMTDRVVNNKNNISGNNKISYIYQKKLK